MVKPTPKEILKKYWNYDDFRSIQEVVINSVLAGNDTIAFAQTGMGKTVLFQIPAMILEGITIVISPLLALQKDQVDACISKGIPATMLNSALGVRARKQVIQDIQDDKFKIIYVAPETLLTEAFREILKDKIINFIAVDESHCFKEDVKLETNVGQMSFKELYQLKLNINKF
jgi:ATP-dependent DNA helicase RecQ